ncbi:MAG TPA: transcriptional repressor [Candidatus Dorea intestinavium]|nr:transcriptional repressor [Candidatus Dorea intestinavium]
MNALKSSRQRTAILEYLANTKEHPTADTIYENLRKTFPNISLGTVYRNLNLLAEMHDIIKITTESGGVRFDYDTSPHYHVVCSSCGKVEDLKISEKAIKPFLEKVNQSYDGTIESHSILFYGKCKTCSDKDHK